MTKLRKVDYWTQLVEYYYDNIHWSEPETRSLYKWLKDDYNASTGLHNTYIQFENPADATMFMLKWS